MRHLLPTTLILVLATFVAACGIAKYRNVEVHIVSPFPREPISNVHLRVVYTKPMLDMTYQRRDSKLTGPDGRATLRIATNHSQFFILGRTHGIYPAVVVSASGYPTQDFQVPVAALTGAAPFVIQLRRRQN